MRIDRTGLAEFLRHRRDALRPDDVGLTHGHRRRTNGLRREEVAGLCHMSTDYYTRLEQERGPQPSEQMIASIAQGLHLTPTERDHLFRLAGHTPPERSTTSEPLSAGLLRVFDRLHDTPAEIVTELGETLRQTPLSISLTGDLTKYHGPARSIGYRWFTDHSTRKLYAPEDQPILTRSFASGLREVLARRGPESRAAHLAKLLLSESDEFRTIWDNHEIGIRPPEVKHFIHPEHGPLELACQTLLDPHQSHSLLVYTAIPGSESHQKLHRMADGLSHSVR
jgi:transcriptional regulator with XRE-family HTH domain